MIINKMSSKKLKKIELLSPAGNFEKLKYALAFGADAVYCGLPAFSLRSRLNDFTPAKLKETIEYVHQQKKKIYLTLNIYAHNRHLKAVINNLKLLKKLQPDGVIISDPGIIVLARKILPKNIKLILSTQANCTNFATAKFWYDQGIRRIILAREVTLDEIKEIKKQVPKLELEIFVHGAMCMSYSGRCLLSAWLSSPRSANLGDCTQPCRWKYKTKNIQAELEEEFRPGEAIPIEQDEHGTYILNSKDLCLIKYLDQIIKAGVDSIKIEGRTKSVAYVAAVTKIYRTALELGIMNSELRNKEINKLYKELEKISNREFTAGFVFGEQEKMQYYPSSYKGSEYEFVGQVLGKFKVESAKLKIKESLRDGLFYKIKIHNVLRLGQIVEFVPPVGGNFKLKINNMIDADTGERIKEVHGGQEKAIWFKSKLNIPKMTILRLSDKIKS